jgi:hypothetical protein
MTVGDAKRSGSLSLASRLGILRQQRVEDSAPKGYLKVRPRSATDLEA